MTNGTEPADGVLRRTILKASAVAVGTLGMIAPTAAASHDEENDDEADADVDDEYGDPDDGEVDEPDGFAVDVLAPHASFPDDVGAEFTLEFAEQHEGDPITAGLDDASNLIVARVTWQPGGTSGWHRHPGPVLVNITEGELELVWERDCIPRTYTAGEAFLDPGEVHIADNPSGTDCAEAYVTFLGVPDEAPATEWVEPVDC